MKITHSLRLARLVLAVLPVASVVAGYAQNRPVLEEMPYPPPNATVEVRTPGTGPARPPITLEGLYRQADFVAEVHVEKTYPATLLESKRKVVTDSLLKVDRVFKGAKKDNIVISQDVGRLEDRNFEVRDYAIDLVRPGEHYFVFLSSVTATNLPDRGFERYGIVGAFDDGLLRIDGNSVQPSTLNASSSIGMMSPTQVVMELQSLEQRSFSLPRDPAAPIIMLTRRLVYAPLSRTISGCDWPDVSESSLTVQAGGTVTLTDGPDALIAVTTLSPDQVQSLLRFAIVDQNFFAFDSAKVDRAIQAEYAPQIPVLHGTTTTLRINIPEKDHTARRYALASETRAYPSVKALEQLSAVEARLWTIADPLKNDLQVVLSNALDQANQALKRERSEMPPVSLGRCVTTMSQNGETATDFVGFTPENSVTLFVRVETKPNEPPRTTVRTLQPSNK